MADYFDLSVASIDKVKSLVNSGWLELNEFLCKHLSLELQCHRVYLKTNENVLRGPYDNNCKLRVAMLMVFAVIKQAENLVQQCCGRNDSDDKPWPHWVERALTVREIKEDVFDIILHLRWWISILKITLSTNRSDSRMKNTTASSSGLSERERRTILHELNLADEKFEINRSRIRTEIEEGAANDKRDLIRKLQDVRGLHDREPQTMDRNSYLISTQLLYLLSDNMVERGSDLNEHQILDSLGFGISGVVSLVTWCGSKCALKKVQVSKSADQRSEAKSLKRFHHPHIVKFFHDWEAPQNTEHSDANHCYILMEAMPTDLEQKKGKIIEGKSSLKRKSTDLPELPFSEPVAIDIMLQVVRGLCHMHDQGVIHRDIKLKNILVRPLRQHDFKELASMGYLQVKLGDFGLVRENILSSFDGKLSAKVGTTKYRAPEIADVDYVNGPIKYPKSADVWSFSIMSAEVLTGKEAFSNMSRVDLVENLKKGKRPWLPDNCPVDLRSCLEKCWSIVPQARPKFPEVWKMLRFAQLRSLGLVDFTPQEKPQSPDKIISHAIPRNLEQRNYTQNTAKQPYTWNDLLKKLFRVTSLLQFKRKFGVANILTGSSVHIKSIHDVPYNKTVNPVWPNPGGDDWKLDVYFFEGNVGSRKLLSCRDTWLQRDQSNVFWPQAWLPQDVRGIRVSVSEYTIPDTGLDAVVEKLKRVWLFSDHKNQNRNWQHPTVLVGHSLGCAVIQALVVDLHDFASKNQLSKDGTVRKNAETSRAFLDSLAGVFFYAPPKMGLVRDSFLLEKVFGGLDSSEELFNNFYTGSESLKQTLERFLQVVASPAEASSRRIRCMELNEGRPTDQKMVVPGGSEQISGFILETQKDSDHVNICKPVDRHHRSYQKLVEFLKDIDLAEQSVG